MKDMPPALQAHLKGELTQLAELVKITRTDGIEIGLTTHDADIFYDGLTYRADGAFTPEVLTQNEKLRDAGEDVTGLLVSDLISDEDIRKGFYDHARLDVSICNWADLSQGVVPLRRGWLGEIAIRDGRYVAHLRGLHDLLEQKIGETYTPECRYDLGDGRCGIDLSALKVSGSVTSAADRQNFTDLARTESDGFFDGGVLTWLTGENAGAKIEIRTWDAAARAFALWLPADRPIAPGDAYEAAPGCDKRYATCRKRFDNGVNYGGFPYLPGLGKILDYPDSR